MLSTSLSVGPGRTSCLGLRSKWGWVAIRPRASTRSKRSYPTTTVLCILAALVWACSCFCLFKLLPWKPTNSVQFSLWNKCWTWSANHTCHLFLDHISKAQVRPLLMTITEKLRNQVKVFLSYDLKTMNTYCWLYHHSADWHMLWNGSIAGLDLITCLLRMPFLDWFPSIKLYTNWVQFWDWIWFKVVIFTKSQVFFKVSINWDDTLNINELKPKGILVHISPNQ